MQRFVDFLALWTAVNMIAWFTLWWTYDNSVTWEDEGHLLLQTSLAATAITLAVWGVQRASREGSAVPRKYSKAVEDRLDATLQAGKEERMTEQVPVPLAWVGHAVQEDEPIEAVLAGDGDAAS